MKRRSLFLAIAAGLMISGIGALEARAGQIPLPAALSTLEPAGSYAIVGNLEFSGFTYTPTPAGSPPPASGVTVNPFTSISAEPGIQFAGGFFAGAGTIVDYAITFKVTALSGTISDAYLAITGGTFGGTGSIDVGESITTTSGAQLATLDAFIPGAGVSSGSFAPQTSILVTKDIFLFGGSAGATVSVINQGFSSSAVPEPASMALLGIGMTGFLAFRRLFKRTSVA